MKPGRRYLTGTMRLIEGKGALSTLQTHLEDLGIRNPEWIVRSSGDPYIRTRIQPLQQSSEEPVDAMIVLGGTGELGLALDALSSLPQEIPLILIPSGLISPSQLIAARRDIALMVIDEVPSGRLKHTEIKQLVTLSLFYLLASLIEPYDPMITSDARYILSRALRVIGALSESRRQASYLTTTILPITVEMGRNRKDNQIISLMEHITVHPFTIFDSAGMLLLPLVHLIRGEYGDLYAGIGQLISEPDVASWVSFWKEGICDDQKETTLRLLSSRLEQILCERETDNLLSTFFGYLREEAR